MNEVKIFSGSSSQLLAGKICQQVGVSPSPFKIKEYANGCFEVVLQDSVKDCKVFLIQTSIPQTLHRDLEELRQMINAAKENGAREIIVVMPYVSYARSDKEKSDKKYIPGMAIAGKLLIELLKESGTVKVKKAGKVIRVNRMTRFIGIDFHSKKFAKFLSELDVRAYHLSALPLIVRYLKKKNLKNAIVLPADKGASKNANFLARELNVPVGSVDKTRISDTKARIEKITGEVAGKDVIFFDDEISPAATTVTTLGKELEKRGAKSLTVAVTHASIINKTIRKLMGIKILKEIIVTDTVPIPREASESLPLRVISVAEILAETIREISKEKA